MMFRTLMLDVELNNLKLAYDVPLEEHDSIVHPGSDQVNNWSDVCHPTEFCESQHHGEENEEEENSSPKISYKCCFCSYTGTIEELQCHIECSHCGMNMTDHWCRLCQLNFEDKAVFERHQVQEHLLHRREDSKKFNDEKLLLDHLPVRSEENKKKPSFMCSTCHKLFFTHRYFIRHLERHEKVLEQLFKCHDCGKGFTKKESMVKHAKIHSRDSLKCSLCEYTCEKRITLKMHLISHEGTRKYKCKHCDYSFKQIGHLKRHILRFKH